MARPQNQRLVPSTLFSLAIIAAATLANSPVSAQAKKHSYAYITSTSTTTTSTPSPATGGYFKPVQVVKTINPNTTASSEKKAEVLPTPLRFSDYRAYGLPAYNGPESFLPRRNGADYATNSAGFVVSDLRPAESSSRNYDMASSSSRIHQYNQRSPSRYHEKRSRSDYSPQETSASDELATYLKTAASETSQTEQSSSSSQGSNSNGFAQRQPAQRRKPNTFNDKPSFEDQSSFGFDPASSKHFLKTHFRDSDLSTSGFMDGHGEQVSASNDNELAQLAASMSELQSNPSSSSANDMFQSGFQGGLGQSGDLSGFDAHAFHGGLGSLGSASMNSQLPTGSGQGMGMGQFGGQGGFSQQPGSQLGVPAGAIVGAPGSAPPPGMKLAGYVTMAGQQQQQQQQQQGMGGPMGGGMNGGMGGMGQYNPAMAGSMMNPMAQQMMRNPMMSSSMRYPGMMAPPGMGGMGGMGGQPGFGPMMGMNGMGGPGPNGPPGMGGSGGMSPALQSLIGSTFGNQLPKGLMGGSPSNGNSSPNSSSGQGSQASASSAAPSRTFLSRLNPLNLFRRLRSRNQPKEPNLNNLESMLTSESRRKSFFLKRSGESDDLNDTVSSANSPFAMGMYRRSNGLPPFRFQGGASDLDQRPPATSRRGRRLHTSSARVPYFESESRPVSLMGSGNFEVIRGGFFSGAGGNSPNEQPHSGPTTIVNNHGRNHNEQAATSSVLDPDDANVFSALEDDFFGAGSPGILGFQGFNHFSGASIYNSLAPSNQKKIEVMPEALSLDGQATATSNSPVAKSLSSSTPSPSTAN